MKISSLTILVFMFVCWLSNTVTASDEYQVQPPVFPRDLQQDGSTFNRYAEFESMYFPPLMYFTLSAQSERTWFDRRLAWDTYAAQLVVDSGMFGAKLQTAFSQAGFENFKLFDTRLDVYAYFPEQLETLSVGGGLSIFNSVAYEGLEFLNDQHVAAFVDIQFVVVEAKFAMLFNDDFFNGALLEVKLYNALLYSALDYQKRLKMDPSTASIVRFVMPSEIGITSAFGLPEGYDALGWFVKNRYVFLRFTHIKTTDFIDSKTDQLLEKKSVWGICGETYWVYKGGIGNDRVVDGWEFGIKFTLVGF